MQLCLSAWRMSGARDSVGREARSEAFALFSDLSEVASDKARKWSQTRPRQCRSIVQVVARSQEVLQEAPDCLQESSRPTLERIDQLVEQVNRQLSTVNL